MDHVSEELGYSVDTNRLEILGTEIHVDEFCRARYSLVLRVRDKLTNTTFTAAIVHLCGGRDEDMYFSAGKGSRRAVVASLVEEHNPDIILGDFNGVCECDSNGDPVDTEGYRYYVADIMGFGADEKHYSEFVSWLQEPDAELKSLNYERVAQDEATTPFGHNVDHIYYNLHGVFKNGVVAGSVKKVELFNLGKVAGNGMFNPNGNTESVSDHHAVCVKLKIQRQ